MKFIDVHENPRRIVGVAKDVDDENIVPGPAFTIYHPFEQIPGFVGRMFVHTRQDPYALVAPMTRVIREMAADQPVERAATLDDVRAEVLTPDRLNTIVFGGFAAVALVISIVGVAGVLAFSVSARTREFGIRLAIGSQPTSILTGVLREGVVMVTLGIAAGAVGGYALARVIASYIQDIKLPGAVPIAGSATVLVIAAVTAALLPAFRASRVDVIEALRSE
jgi:ABC-type antimicrobial peptide transport system permease subunit